jgi:RNA 2',3'-cyclic 3'-phosphodiesterase
MNSLRLFLAIPIPETVKAELHRLQVESEPWLPSRAVRWTRPDQFHLTLKFLGNVPTDQTSAVSEAVRDVCAASPPLRLRAEGVGFFPNESSPRIFWVEIKSLDGRLTEFQRRLDTAVERFAEKEESKQFTAHVTLARMEKLGRREVEGWIARLPRERAFGEWTAGEVELVQSTLSPSGAIHAIFGVFKTKNE